MRRQRKSLWVALCGMIAACGVILGICSSAPVQVDAATTAPTLTMEVGASVRKTPGDPGVKFKATIDNWDNSYQYGMMILPAQAWDTFSWWGKDVDYVNELLGKGLVAGENFIQAECPAYVDKDGSIKIALAMTDIYAENYAEEFVGVAYAEKGGQYIYSPVNEFDNARSITYVAQKALQYEAETLDDTEETFLRMYANPGMKIDKDTYFTDSKMEIGGETNEIPADYAMQYIFNVSGETVSQVTKKAYPGGSTVSFKYYIPVGTVTSWWGISWTTQTNELDIYATADESKGYQPSKVTGEWTDVSFTLPAGGPYYLYFGSEIGTAHGRWMLNGENSYVLIDDFAVDGEIDRFTDNLSNGIFDVKVSAAVKPYQCTATNISFGKAVVEDETDYMVAFNGAAIGGHESIAMITDKTYADVSEITFKGIWTGEVTSDRWGLSYTTDPTQFSYGADVNTLNCYTPKLGELKKDVGVAYNYKLVFSGNSYTLYANDMKIGSGDFTQGANYFYFMVCPAVKGTGMAFYMDDFSITYADGTVSDSFAEQASTLFVESVTKNSNNGSAGMNFEETVFEEVTETPEVVEKELALKILLNNSNDGVRARTADMYAGGSTIEFKYFIQADTKTQWTRFIWDTDSKLDNYADTNTSFGNVPGEWTTWTYTLPSGGPYYLYFGFECGHWQDSSGAPYILIDDFTVNGEVETFNAGVENSIFKILQPDLAMNSAEGEGWTPVKGAFGAKLTIDLISSTATTPSFITAQKYTGGVTVSFDYYISGNTNKKWWTFNWTSNNKQASIYAFNESSTVNFGKEISAKTQDTWMSASVEVPAGEWYFYFGGAVGEWSGGYVIIDNFKIGDTVVETFNDGTYGIFLDNRDSKPDAITIADGMAEFIPGEYSAKLDFTDSFNLESKTFITKKAYAKGGSIVSFQYMIPNETTVGDWWALCWTTDATNPDFWAVGKGAVSGCGGVNPNPDKNKGQGWVNFSCTLPNDGNMYYLYIVGYSNWNGCVYIDNFQIKSSTGPYVDDFTDGYRENSLFNINKNYVGLGEGSQVDIEEDEDTITDPTSLAYLLKNGTIVDYLEGGGFAWLATKTEISIDKTDLPMSSLLLEGTLGYKITGNKEFAVYFGNGGFLYVSESKIALYNGTSLVKELTYTTAADASLTLGVTAGGKVIVKVENDYIGLGKLTGDVTMVKLIALGGDGKAEICTIALDTYYVTLSNAPIYFSEEEIDFTAYAFDSGAMISNEGFQLLADAGFTKTLALLQGRLNAGDLHEQDIPDRAHVEKLMAEVNADAMAALALAEKYGLKHYVLNSNLYNLERNKNNYQWVDDFAELATYTLSEAFAGHFLADEPEHTLASITQTELEELVNAYKAYKQAYPNGEAFINLLPMTNATLDSTYKTYVQYYIENIALDKNGVPGTGYVSFDHYPLLDSDVSSKHLRNLEIVGEMCRDYGIELRTYIKASTTGDTERDIRATESVNDLYMQIYSALAYGSKEIIYYQFTDHTKTDGTAGDAVISGSTLEKGNVYNWTKQANNEVKAFSAAYMNFKWKSVSVFGKTNITQFSNLKSKASAYGYLTSVSSSASVLVGNFDDFDGVYDYSAKHGYMVVNYGNTDNMTHATSDITLTFNSSVNKVLVYENGNATVMSLNNNAVTLKLEMGEGAFVIPFKA